MSLINELGKYIEETKQPPLFKILVGSEQQKQDLLKESEYIHFNEHLDSDFANTLMHLYEMDESIIVVEGEEGLNGTLDEFTDAGMSVEKGFTEDDADPQELKVGTKIEMEHTVNPSFAKKIALDHLSEIPDYYTRLIAMEKEAGRDIDEMLSR